MLQPQDIQELSELIAQSMSRQQPLAIAASATKAGIGRPVGNALPVELSRFSGVLDYEPAELVLTARAATPLTQIQALLAEQNQMLAFEPGDWRWMWNSGNRQQTIGGVLACNLAGPRRIFAGAARDHLLGFQAVNGRGEQFKAGGKVVKNVTGYDLCKLIAGSYGTLAVLTEVTVKVMPRPQASLTLVIPGLNDRDAVKLMSRALRSTHEISAAAHVPAALAGQLAHYGAGVPQGAITALRLEGPEPSIAHRCRELTRELDDHGIALPLDAQTTQRFWMQIGNAEVFTPDPDTFLWRISSTASGSAAMTALTAEELRCEWFYDWGGAQVWLSVASTAASCGAASIRRALLHTGGGHATLLRAPDWHRSRVAVFQPLAPQLFNLSLRVKRSFDPGGILNPERMYAGI